jgi:hypothetical protein
MTSEQEIVPSKPSARQLGWLSALRPRSDSRLNAHGIVDAPLIRLHVFIRPLGVRAILGVASAEISSLVLNLSDIWGNRAGDLIEMLLAANTWRQRFAILDRGFVSKLNPASPQPEIAWAWRRLQKTHGSVPIQRLADELGWSRQQIAKYTAALDGADIDLASQVWRTSAQVSFIHPAGHARGWEEVKEIYKFFGSSFSERKLTVRDVSVLATTRQ